MSALKLRDQVDIITVGKGAYENFRCSKCHYWKETIADAEYPKWGNCVFIHDRMVVSLPETREDFACVEYTAKRA